MSAEDCILYRRIGKYWYVLGWGTTFNEFELDDVSFAWRSPEIFENFQDAMQCLQATSQRFETEHGICYAANYTSEVPPEVPAEHRSLCCLPENEKPIADWNNPSNPIEDVRKAAEEAIRNIGKTS